MKTSLPYLQYQLQREQIFYLHSFNFVFTVLVALLNAPYAPVWLLLIGPAFYGVLAYVRLGKWLQHIGQETSSERAEAMIAPTQRITTTGMVVMSIWAFSVSSYADPITAFLTQFFVLMSTIGVASCLTYLPSAANAVLTIAGVAYGVYATLFGDYRHLLVAAIYLLTALLFFRLVRQFHKWLVELVDLTNNLTTQKKLAEQNREEAAHLARHDQLTNLPNRRYFVEYLDELEVRAKTSDALVVVGLIDLDNFKPINDLYGHPAGDALLVKIAKIISEVFSGHAKAFRLGGDEFGFVSDGQSGKEEIGDLVDKFLCAIKEPMEISGYTATISASVGLSRSNQCAEFQDVTKHADFALYKAKQAGGNACVVFSESMELEVNRTNYIKQALHESAAVNNMHMLFQPIVRCADGSVSCVEALPRWNDVRYGDIPPDEFIRVAEEIGLIKSISESLIGKMLESAHDVPSGIRTSINISAKQFSEDAFATEFLNHLDRHDINGEQVQIELTETSVINSIDRANYLFDALQERGVLIALDDFGSRYASFFILEKLKFDKLKVDKSVIIANRYSRSNDVILNSIASLCRNLGIVCVAEGVETELDYEMAKAAGCGEVQGFWAGAPKLLEELAFAPLGKACSPQQADQMEMLSDDAMRRTGSPQRRYAS